ncbi:MAG TPA: hypothetical protein VIO32_07570 [Candidatus Baltobacteraceae bacterium]
MAPRYLAALALTLALPAVLPAAASPARHRHAERRAPAPGAAVDASALYSRRALRRARIILELKLLELRSERLERVRETIEKHIPLDDLLKTP